MAMLLIGARITANVLRSRRFHNAVIVSIVGLWAAARIGREGQASGRRRISAWDTKRLQRFEDQRGRRAERVARRADRQARRLERKTKIPAT